MVVRRGYRRPPSLHQDRLREAPVGHFFDVITNGFGAMPDYAAQIKAEDRWAIVAYIRALQLSAARDARRRAAGRARTGARADDAADRRPPTSADPRACRPISAGC